MNAGSSRWVRLQAVVVSGSACDGLMLAAIPLLAVSITTDPRQVSLVNVAGQAPWLLFSLFAGVLIDRIRRTTALALAYAVQVVAALALALSASTGLLSLPVMLVVAFVVTSGQVLGAGASGALVPELVDADRLAAANTRLQVLEGGVTEFIMPPVTGLLLTLAAGLPAWVACVMAVAAFGMARSIPSAPIVAQPAHPLNDLVGGLRHLVKTPLLRSITVTVTLGAFAASASMSMFVLYATQVLHVGTVGYGVLIACFGIGWVSASFFVQKIVTRFGYSRSMLFAQVCAVVAQFLVAVVPPWPVLIGAVLVFQTATALVWNVCSQSSRQLFTPPELLGRVLTSHRALAWGLTPLGALAGGLVAVHWSLRGVYVMAAAVHFAGALVVWWKLSPAAFRAAELVRASESRDGVADGFVEDGQAQR